MVSGPIQRNKGMGQGRRGGMVTKASQVLLETFCMAFKYSGSKEVDSVRLASFIPFVKVLKRVGSLLESTSHIPLFCTRSRVSKLCLFTQHGQQDGTDFIAANDQGWQEHDNNVRWQCDDEANPCNPCSWRPTDWC